MLLRRAAICLIMCLPAASLAGAVPRTYYVAPGGSDAAAGTIDAPFQSLTQLSVAMVPGDHAYVRGGTYAINRALVPAEEFEHLHYMIGTASQGFLIENYPGEKPVFDYTGSTYPGGANALNIIGTHYLHLKGLRFTNLAQMADGSMANGLAATSSPDNIFENIEVDHIGGFGFALGSGSHNNLFLNCDAHHIDDRLSNPNPWKGANGFNITGGVDADNTTFDGCRAWFCSDDGFDLFRCNGFVTITNCWSFWNGYFDDAGTRVPVGDGMGFKMGPITDKVPTTVRRLITGNLAFENKVGGFDENGNYDGQGIFHIYRNRSFNNGTAGFICGEMSGVVHDVRDNVSIQDPEPLSDAAAHNPLSGAEWWGSGNSWNLADPPTAADYRSVTPTGVDGARAADGSLPNLPFMKPKASSDEGKKGCGGGTGLSMIVSLVAMALSARRR